VGSQRAGRWEIPRRAHTPIVLAVGAVCILGLVALSPFALQWMAPGMGEDWNRLSAIGQTYSAIATILSALAVMGIVASIIIQSRQARVEQWHAIRGFHKELLIMALEDPKYRESWGLSHGLTGDEWERHTYTRLVTHYLWMGAETGVIPWESIQANAANMFEIQTNVDSWGRMRTRWLVDAQTSRERRFVEIFEAEYAAAVARRSEVDGPLPAAEG